MTKRPTTVLVICHDYETARQYIASKGRCADRLYVWAPRWSCVVGWNKEHTEFVAVGDYDVDEQTQQAFWWLKDNGFREIYPP